MPKLIYIKASAHRDERLNELIDRIRSDDTAAYLPFETTEQLEEQIVGDLATLLAERFDAARGARPRRRRDGSPTSARGCRRPSRASSAASANSPKSSTCSAAASTRVVTLLGPGGIGKSRLAIETAAAAEHLFPDGTVFIALENVLEPNLLLPTIAYGLGIRDSSERAARGAPRARARAAAACSSSSTTSSRSWMPRPRSSGSTRSRRTRPSS